MTLKLPTPSTSHLDFSTIYEPAEDSFLFLDTLSSAAETEFLGSRFAAALSNDNEKGIRSNPLVVEVGTGSGVVLAFVTAHAQNIFGRSDVLTLGVDVNEHACRGTAETARRAVAEAKGANGERNVVACPTARGDRQGETCADGSGNSISVNGEADYPDSNLRSGLYLGNLCSDLTTSFRPGSVDVLLFNPPYVPTEQLPDPAVTQHRDRFDEESHLLALSYAGGVDGMEVTERLLDQLPVVLSPRGVAYILFCARNKPKQALHRNMQGPQWAVKSGCVWATETVGKTGGKGGWERLEIVRIWRRWETRMAAT